MIKGLPQESRPEIEQNCCHDYDGNEPFGYFLEAADQNVDVIASVELEVFATQRARGLSDDLVANILQGLVHERLYVFNNQELELDICDVLDFDKQSQVEDESTMHVRIKDPENHANTSGRYIDKRSTVVKHRLLLTETMSGDLHSRPSHSAAIFDELSHAVARNLSEPRKIRINVLLAGEDTQAKLDLARKFSKFLGLDFCVTSGRSLVGETTAITEANITKVVKDIRNSMPTVWVIR